MRVKEFIYKHPDLFTILGLSVIFYFLFFHNIWAYALMDVDESRYVVMSKEMFNTKDFLTLYLNGEYFFEKPPLYFWIECLSFGLFGKITEFTARFPVAMLGTIACFVTYFLGKKVVSRNYGVISSLILATSVEYIILAKFAILDIVLTAFVWFSLASGIMTFFCKENNKKYFWWLFYIFSGLAVMAKGIPGFVIPFGSMFFISITAKKFKEIFRPQYFIIGVILFLLIVTPWHYIMLKMHNPLFFNEYIMKHHIARFMGKDTLNRQQPFWFFFVTLLWGFMPWAVSCIAVLLRKLTKKDWNFKELTQTRKFLLYNGIIAIFTILFFSSSDTKLITYILPVYPSLSLLAGYIWWNYTERGEYSRIINKTVYVVGAIFILASFCALFTQLYLPEDLNWDILPLKPLFIGLFLFTGIFSILFAKREKFVRVFFTYVIFIICLSAFGTEKIFKFDYKFGQNDLINFAQYLKGSDKEILCYKFKQKYSIIYYSDKHMINVEELSSNDLHKNTVIILKKKNYDDIKQYDYYPVLVGKKYVLLEKQEK